METIWFCLVAFMIAAYVVLDGFDLGAGILHLLIARTEPERQIVLRAIGPVWDANQVWRIAGAGTLYFAFPLLYASGFSGFYLPLTLVLWLLILRGIGIEFRMHLGSAVWRGLFDGFFALSSLLLAVMFGVALANVLRGVPLRADGYFFEPLWTDWRVGPEPGILDWYTVIGGATALAALAMHGATYLALKSEGDLNVRAHRLALHDLDAAPRADRAEPGGHARGPSTIARQLPEALDQRAHPAGSRCEYGRDPGLRPPPLRAGGVSELGDLPGRDAGWGGRSTLPDRAALERRFVAQHHDFQCGGWSVRAVSGPLVVDRRNPAGRRLLRLRLPHVQRES